MKSAWWLPHIFPLVCATATAFAQTSILIEESVDVTSPKLTAPANSENAAELEKFTQLLKSEPELMVYEGLPHQNLERKAFAAEVARGDVMDSQGYFFYSKALKISEEDAARLRKTFLKHTSSGMSLFAPAKRCGGFHPDYCLAWTSKTEHYETLICFGCSEIAIVSRHFSLRRDLKSAFENELKSILTKYVVNRPQRAVPKAQ